MDTIDVVSSWQGTCGDDDNDYADLSNTKHSNGQQNLYNQTMFKCMKHLTGLDALDIEASRSVVNYSPVRAAKAI